MDNKWMMPRIIDYWDTRVQAVSRMSRLLAKLTEPDRTEQLGFICDAISEHVSALTDEQLKVAAFVIVDDLYSAPYRRDGHEAGAVYCSTGCIECERRRKQTRDRVARSRHNKESLSANG